MKERINKLIEISEELCCNNYTGQLRRFNAEIDEKTYLLSVMGQFSSGKSRLINNLIGKNILPVHITETTAIITFIRYAEEDHAELLYKDGTYEETDIEATLDMWQSGSGNSRLSELESMNICVRCDLLKNGLIIADTPGVNTVISRHVELTKNVIESSDRVLYVLKKPATESDISFVETIRDNGVKVMFVRTHMDEMKSNEEQADVSVIKEKESISEYTDDEIFFISNEKESSYYYRLNDLRKYLSVYLAENIDEAVEENIGNRTIFIAEKLENILDEKRIALSGFLNGKREEYNTEKAEIEKSVSRMEEILEKNRRKLNDKYIRTKAEARENLINMTVSLKKQNERKLESINCESSSEVCEELASGLISDNCMKLRSSYINEFDIMLSENKEELIEQMQDISEFSKIDTDYIPDSIESASQNMSDLKDRIDALNILNEQLQSQIEENKNAIYENDAERAAAEEEAEQLRIASEAVKAQLDEYPPYVARYVTEKGSNENEERFRKIGSVLDVATILIPGPAWAKLGTKILNVGAKGAKSLKAIKAADTLMDGARILNKVYSGSKRASLMVDGLGKVSMKKNRELNRKAKELTQQFDSLKENIVEKKPTLLDYLSIDFYFSKIGKKFDKPDTKKIDREYENEYYSGKEKLQNEYRERVTVEAKKRAEILGIKNKKELLKLESDIAMQKQASLERETKELQRKLSEKARAEKTRSIRKFYLSAVSEKVSDFCDYLLNDFQSDIDNKVQDYINTYDVKIMSDMKKAKENLERLNEEFSSGSNSELQDKLNMLNEYDRYLKNIVKV